MKKVGIVTITNGPDNYGNILQNLAVQYILKEIEYDSETIRNFSYMEHRQNSLYLIPKFIFNRRRAVKSIKFLRFSKKHIQYSPMKVTRKNFPDKLLLERYYKFICGSDQIWNPEYGFNHNWDFNLLKFAKSNQKIAFAASFGIDALTKEDERIFANGLSDFYAISVREVSAVEIVKNAANITPIVLLDPTMILSKGQWQKYCKTVKILKGKKFILKYILGYSNENVNECIDQIQNQYNEEVEVIDLMDETSKYYSMGPDEFLWLIHNAFIVLTDSYHATVFSILFHKLFVVVERSGENKKTFGRLETLLSQFRLENRVYSKVNKCSLLSPVNFEYVDSILKHEKDKTIAFLRTALK